MKRILIACVLTVSLLSSGLILRAADGASSKPKSAAVSEKPKRMPFYGSVKAVDLKAKTLTLKGKEKDRVFLVTKTTRIHNSGTTKKLTDVKVGRKVGGLAKANATGKWEVATLNLGVKQQRTSSKRTTTKDQSEE
jgi:hypothetical protein